MKKFKITTLLFLATLTPTSYMLRESSSIKITDSDAQKNADILPEAAILIIRLPQK